MANILITYSTTDGHTRSICERLQQVVEDQQHTVVVSWMSDDPEIDLQPFDKVIIGASIRYGKHQPQVFDFIKRNQATLESKQSAFFSVNVVARKPEKNQPETNPYLQKFLKQISWQPENLAAVSADLLADNARAQLAGLADARVRLGNPGASRKAAEAVSEYLDS